jgi:hypothetical protein
MARYPGVMNRDGRRHPLPAEATSLTKEGDNDDDHQRQGPHGVSLRSVEGVGSSPPPRRRVLAVSPFATARLLHFHVPARHLHIEEEHAVRGTCTGARTRRSTACRAAARERHPAMRRQRHISRASEAIGPCIPIGCLPTIVACSLLVCVFDRPCSSLVLAPVHVPRTRCSSFWQKECSIHHSLPSSGGVWVRTRVSPKDSQVATRRWPKHNP